MDLITYPPENTWEKLCKRPVFDKTNLDNIVLPILKRVKNEGDLAVRDFTARFDGKKTENLLVSENEVFKAKQLISYDLKKAIQLASSNIKKFHTSQLRQFKQLETSPGVTCWQESRPIERVGLYIPGGSAPLFSTVLMLAIPAMIAGCKEIVATTPPDATGRINPAILYSASLCGVTKIIAAGGAQAIAAMAYGTETVPRVYKIFGPGNQYVTRAKELVQLEGTAIDMPAGPSEVLIIADKYANPSFIAADLLSQAEHGTDSQVILLSDNQKLIEDSLAELNKQVEVLPRVKIAKEVLKNSKCILLDSISSCIKFSNHYAPEHLILNTEKPDQDLLNISSAGSVFLGPYSCESAGDYASGTNHTLPTNGYARSYSGVSLSSFQKTLSIQKINSKGLQNIGPSIEVMAEAEDLLAHKNAVSIRLKTL